MRSVWRISCTWRSRVRKSAHETFPRYTPPQWAAVAPERRLRPFHRPEVSTFALSRLTGIDQDRLPVGSTAPAVADSIALLRTSYRFGPDSGIGRLATQINAGQWEQALTLLTNNEPGQTQ